MEKRIKLSFPPGLRSNGTEYGNAGRWVDGNLVRFFEGTIREIGGWTARTVTGDTVAGVPTAAVAWTPEIIGLAQRPILAMGTTSGLYVLVDGAVSDITPTGFTADASLVWSLDVFGSYLVATAWSYNDYSKSQGPFVWTGDINAVAQPLEDDEDAVVSPPSVTALVVTEERFLFALGGVDVLGPNYTNYPTVPSTRTVLWPSRETLTDWTPASTNSAGSFPLVTHGDLRQGLRVRGQTLLLTTTDAHVATFIGGEFVYRFAQIGTECGTFAPHSGVATDVGAFWMGPKGFFAYDGQVKPLPCEVSDAVFGALNLNYQHRVWAFHNAAFGEVTWFYPTGTSEVPNAFVTFSYREGHWTKGTLTRCAGVSSQPPGQVPVLLDATGVVYDHETGRVPSGNTVFLRSGPFELGEGDRVFAVQALIPDERNVGDLRTTLYTRLEPTATETTHGPFSHAARTSMRCTARQVSLRFDRTTTGATNDWRLGTMRLAVTPGGSR